MDPVTAISLTCNVLQVVEVSWKVVTSAREAYSNSSGYPSKLEDFAVITTDLKDVNGRLLENLERTRGEQAFYATAEDIALRDLCEACNRTAQQLTEALQGLQASGNYRRLGSVKVSIKAIWKRHELDELSVRLQSFRTQLNARLSVDLRGRISLLQLQQSQEFQRLDQRTRETLDGVYANRRHLQESNENQTEVINNLITAGFDKQQEQLRDMLQPMPAVIHSRSPSREMDGLPLHYDEIGNGQLQGEKPQNSIFEAAEKGEVSAARRIVRRDPQAVFLHEEATGMTCLHHACRRGHHDMALYLIRNGARLNSDDDNGLTPLHCSAMSDSPALVRALLDKGADPDAKDNDGGLPVAYAQSGSEVEWIFRYGSKLSAWDQNGETALHHFSQLGDTATVQSLLEQKADPSMPSRGPVTPLIIAAEFDRVDIVDLLVSHGVDLEGENARRDTALSRAAWNGKPNAVRKLIGYGANVNVKNQHDFSPLNEAAYHGHVEVARVLLENGADVMNINDFGYSALQHAAREGYLEIVEACLEFGAPVDLAGRHDITALHEAADHDRLEIAQALLNAGAQVNPRADSGHTPLHYAAKRGHTDVVRTLITAGAGIELRERTGWVALIEAACFGRLEATRLLVESGANVEAETNEGRTALTLACVNGHETVVKYLVEEAKGDIEHRIHAGWSALMEASFHGWPKLVQFLLDHGARTDWHTNGGVDAVGLAQQSEHLDVRDSIVAMLTQGAQKSEAS